MFKPDLHFRDFNHWQLKSKNQIRLLLFTWIFLLLFSTSIVQSLIGIYEYCAYCLDIPLIHKDG